LKDKVKSSKYLLPIGIMEICCQTFLVYTALLPPKLVEEVQQRFLRSIVDAVEMLHQKLKSSTSGHPTREHLFLM